MNWTMVCHVFSCQPKYSCPTNGKILNSVHLSAFYHQIHSINVSKVTSLSLVTLEFTIALLNIIFVKTDDVESIMSQKSFESTICQKILLGLI